MHIIVYGILSDDENDELSIDGPYYNDYHRDFKEAEKIARSISASKNKYQIIPWVFEILPDEKIPDTMDRIEKGWFSKFKNRTMEAYETINRDNNTILCPFDDVPFNSFIEKNL